MTETPVRLLILGAHPDDAEFHAGGLMTFYRQRGDRVRIVSVTNGAAGHHRLTPAELVHVRRAEADEVARQFGVEYAIWEFPDGELQATLEVRRRIIREMRTFAPDLVLTHRTCDYHPDHRAVGLAVQDASYLVTVPAIVPEVPALRVDPVVAYMNDLFTRPAPLRPDVVLDVTPYMDEIVSMLACHVSQVFEWLPYNMHVEAELPEDPRARREWLKGWYGHRAQAVAELGREQLVNIYGRAAAATIQLAEAYEISEYAGRLDANLRRRLFPWMTRSTADSLAGQ